MRLTAATLFLGLAAAVPFEGSEDVAVVESRQSPFNPHLVFEGTPRTSGTGCPTPGSTDIIFDKDAQTITISYNSFQVETGPAPLTARSSSRNCKLTALMRFDEGFTLSVFNTVFTGNAVLTKGVTGRIFGQASFTGGVGRPTWELRLEGPKQGLFDLAGDPLLMANSTCGYRSATLNIDITMTISPPPPSTGGISGTIGGSTLEGALKQILHIEWQRCRK